MDWILDENTEGKSEEVLEVDGLSYRFEEIKDQRQETTEFRVYEKVLNGEQLLAFTEYEDPDLDEISENYLGQEITVGASFETIEVEDARELYHRIREET